MTYKKKCVQCAGVVLYGEAFNLSNFEAAHFIYLLHGWLVPLRLPHVGNIPLSLFFIRSYYHLNPLSNVSIIRLCITILGMRLCGHSMMTCISYADWICGNLRKKSPEPFLFKWHRDPFLSNFRNRKTLRREFAFLHLTIHQFGGRHPRGHEL